MKLAIMQPYFMPYIGYFQLIMASDKFVIYDDVTYIKQGWINRNQVLINGEAKKFSIPLRNGSSNVLIKDIEISEIAFDKWKKVFHKTLMSSYGRAPYYNDIMILMDRILSDFDNSIVELSIRGIEETLKYLGLSCNMVRSSKSYNNTDLVSQNRVLDICKKENASIYVNPMGGRELYSRDIFEQNGLELFFIKPQCIAYKQYKGDFVPWLSMIDILMFNSPDEIKTMLGCYDLV